MPIRQMQSGCMTAAINHSQASIPGKSRRKLEEKLPSCEVALASADIVVLDALRETLLVKLSHHDASLELWSQRLG